jgi:hypothetical protein
VSPHFLHNGSQHASTSGDVLNHFHDFHCINARVAWFEETQINHRLCSKSFNIFTSLSAGCVACATFAAAI